LSPKPKCYFQNSSSFSTESKTKFSNQKCVKSLIVKLLSSRILSQTAKISLHKSNFSFWILFMNRQNQNPISQSLSKFQFIIHRKQKCLNRQNSQTENASNFEFSISSRVEIQIRNQLQVKLLSPIIWIIIHVKFLRQSQNLKTKNYFLRPQMCCQFADFLPKCLIRRIAANARYLRFFREWRRRLYPPKWTE